MDVNEEWRALVRAVLSGDMKAAKAALHTFAMAADYRLSDEFCDALHLAALLEDILGSAEFCTDPKLPDLPAGLDPVTLAVLPECAA